MEERFIHAWGALRTPAGNSTPERNPRVFPLAKGFMNASDHSHRKRIESGRNGWSDPLRRLPASALGAAFFLLGGMYFMARGSLGHDVLDVNLLLGPFPLQVTVHDVAPETAPGGRVQNDGQVDISLRRRNQRERGTVHPGDDAFPVFCRRGDRLGHFPDSAIGSCVLLPHRIKKNTILFLIGRSTCKSRLV